MSPLDEGTSESPHGEQLTDHRLRQRDYVLRIARAMSAQLDPAELLSLVIRSAVTMTGGTAGAIAIRRDALAEEPLPYFSTTPSEQESEVEIVASYHLEPRLVEYVHATSGRPRVTPAASAGRKRGTDDDPTWPTTAPTGSLAAPFAPRDKPDEAEPGAGPRRAAPLARIRPVTTPEPQHVLTLPLRFSGEEIGRIVVFRSEGAMLFTPLDEELLRTFSDQAAVAIGNALLHQRLARSERRLAGVVEHSPAGILLLDGSGHVRSANAAAEQVCGRPRSELVGRPLGEALPLIDEQGRPVPSPLDDSMDGGSSAGARDAATDGGSGAAHGRRSARGAILPLAQRNERRPATTAERPAAASTAGDAAMGRPVDLREARWVQLSVTPFDEAGAAGEGFVAVVTDLTAWRDAERAKTAFLAGLSHELKTPLSLIRGFAETLGASELAGEEREAFREHAVEVILDETAHLTRMVDQLLLAARASAGALTLDLHPLAMGKLARELVGQFAQTHPKLRWRLDDEGTPSIMGDPDRLRDVVANLLSNAAKYSPADTEVRVRLSTAPEGGVALRVQDEGRGIAAQDVSRVFERFWRVDETVEGTGLGLYMARAIVTAHGGRIEVEQTRSGRGTTFLVQLPLAPPEGQTALRAPSTTPEEA